MKMHYGVHRFKCENGKVVEDKNGKLVPECGNKYSDNITMNLTEVTCKQCLSHHNPPKLEHSP